MLSGKNNGPKIPEIPSVSIPFGSKREIDLGRLWDNVFICSYLHVLSRIILNAELFINSDMHYEKACMVFFRRC